jgi:hypothetical protein
MDLTHVKYDLSAHTRCAGEKHSTVLIVISWKEMIKEHIEVLPGYSQTARTRHGSFSRKSSTLRIFAPTFCRPLCAALLRRDTWIAGLPSN